MIILQLELAFAVTYGVRCYHTETIYTEFLTTYKTVVPYIINMHIHY